MNLRERCKLWFFSSAENNILDGDEEYADKGFEPDTENNHASMTGGGEDVIDDHEETLMRGGEDKGEKKDNPSDFIKEEIRTNRKMIYETRNWIGRIDERTAFIARIVFAMFVSFIVAVAAGVLLSLLF